jgi:integrase
MPVSTDAEIRNAKPADRPYKLTVGDGLFLLIQPNGSKLWRMKFRYQGKERGLALGAYPEVRLGDARQKARAARRELEEGRNPAVEKRLRVAAERAAAQFSFGELAEEWLKAKKAKVSASYWSKVDTTLRAATKRLAALPVARITAPLILEELQRVESRGAVDLAKRIKQYVSQVFDYAIATGRFAGANPCASISRDVLQAHKATEYPTLNGRADVGAFLRRLAEYHGRPETRIAIELQMLTAVRPGELRGARWEEFDRAAKMWRIPAERMKMRREHIVPLTQRALDLLDELKPYSGHLGFLFPGLRLRQPISEMTLTKALRTIWPAYRIVPHGFRALFSTHANEHGHFRNDVIEAALAHKEMNAIRAAYNRASYLKERRELAEWWTAELESMRHGAQVVPIHSGEAG